MDNYIIRAATETDIPAITDFANQYVYDNLSEDEREAGFLTGRFTLPAMQKMVTSAVSVVAQYQQEIVGFVINSALSPADYPPLLQAMAGKFPEISYRHLPVKAYSYFLYGPVLVSKPHRGRGLLFRMFQQTIRLLRSRFDLGVAFIHEHNHHSLNIHKQYLGLEVVGRFSFKADDYFILAFSVEAERS